MSFVPLHLTTQAEAPQRRAELAREVFGRQILRLDVESIADTELVVDLKLWSLPGLKLLSGHSSGVATPRTRSLLSDGNDDLFISMIRGGRLVAEQRDRQVVLEGDSIHLASNAERMSFIHLDSQAMALLAPRKAIADLAPGLEDRIGQDLAPPRPLLRLLQNYAGSITAAASISANGLAEVVVPHFYDLVALAIGLGRDAREQVANRGLRAARLHAVKSHVAARLGENLSVTAMAVALQLTPRYLQRLFEREGTTFSAYVQEQRLAAASLALADPRRRERRISAIAYECGFRDISHFNHVFKRRNGGSPSDFRRGLTSAGSDEN